jgi:hypothetical protein
MQDLDAAYQLEQLLLEVLLDIRDALAAAGTRAGGAAASAVDKLAAIQKLTKLKT